MNTSTINPQPVHPQLANAPAERPYGSDALNDYEARLVAAFTRSYQIARRQGKTLADMGVSSTDGDIVERTDELMQVHYDENLAFFQSILDTKYMAYSMAYYGETPEEARASTRTLEEAQAAKFDLICKRACVRGDEHVLNVGCGFGSLEKYLLSNYPGIRVTGITPSKVQSAYLREHMADPNHPLGSGRFTLIEDRFDTAPLSALGGPYDAVFTIGVLEHFRNLKAAFEKMAALLVPGGRAFHHLIAAQFPIPGFADSAQTRLRTYFPGGRVWPKEELEYRTEDMDLEESWFVNGMNYWRTIDAWHRRYWEHMDRLYPDILSAEAVGFWNEYFTFCKVMFAPENGTVVGNAHYLFRKPA